MSVGVVVLVGNWLRGRCPTWVIVLQGSCPQGSCPQGSCPRDSCPRTIFLNCMVMNDVDMWCIRAMYCQNLVGTSTHIELSNSYKYDFTILLYIFMHNLKGASYNRTQILQNKALRIGRCVRVIM